ncbi:unnamed protein product, partial [Vitis vinifera]
MAVKWVWYEIVSTSDVVRMEPIELNYRTRHHACVQQS